MAIRTLDSAFWDDEHIASLSFPERLLYACMFTDASLSDDYGCLAASPRTLKKHAFGYDDGVSTEDVQAWRDSIIAKMGKSVVLYRVACQDYIFLTQFEKWQKLRYHRASNVPKPDHPEALLLNGDGAGSGNSQNIPPSSRTDSVVLHSGGEDSVELDGAGEAAQAAQESAPPEADPTTAAPPGPTEQDIKALFALVEKAGIVLNPLASDEYLDVLQDFGLHLLELCFAEAAQTNSRPTVKWLRVVAGRCKREGCTPGLWNKKRAPPGQSPEPGTRDYTGGKYGHLVKH